MKERFEHLPSTLTGAGLFIAGLAVGIIFERWEVATPIITAALYLLAYKPKEDKNAND